MRTRIFRTTTLLVASAAFAGCVADRAPRLKSVHGSLLISESGPDTGVGITAELVGREVVCRNAFRGAAPIGWILFERRGDASAYGVYGLGLGKNPMGAGRPLDGDTIAWPDKDHAQGLAHLLERVVPAAEAAALVAHNDAAWFRPGLRVFFVVPGTPADLAAAPGGGELSGALRIVSLE